MTDTSASADAREGADVAGPYGGRRPLSRFEVMRWNEKWSWSDKERIERNLDRVGAVSFYSPPSGGYIGCLGEAGQTVMTIAPGWVEFPAALANEECEPNWPGFGLSTFRGRGNRTDGPTTSGDFCPVHHMELSLTGSCDLCE